MTTILLLKFFDNEFIVKYYLMAINKDVALLEIFIKEILAHHQKNIMWQWFHHPEFGQTLIDMAKPLYFVTAKLLGNKATETTLLSQAPELKETISDIHDYIIKRQEFYYGKGK